MANATALRKLKRALGHFNAIDGKMQISTVLTLVEIAIATEEEREMTTRDLETTVGIKSGAASRNSYYWGAGHKEMTGGHQFVNVDMDPVDRRLRILSLSEKGKFFINRLKEDLQDGASQR